MIGYFTDLIIASVIIIGLTAVMGVFTNGIGKYVFAHSKRTEFVDQTAKMQTGWNHVGGKHKN